MIAGMDHGAPFHQSLEPQQRQGRRGPRLARQKRLGRHFPDLDPERGIAAGQRWKEALQKAAWRCEVVIALVSKEWLGSSWCKSEVDAARLMGKKVVVALVGIENAVAILVGKHGIGNTQQTRISASTQVATRQGPHNDYY